MQSHYGLTIGDEVVGSADLSEVPGGAWRLDLISIVEDHRGQGFGGALLDVVVSQADASGDTVILDIPPEPDGPIDARHLCKWFGRHGWISADDDLLSMSRTPAG